MCFATISHLDMTLNCLLIAMTELGVSQDDLKPAFLLLSSCETDLARRARSTQSTLEVAGHYKNAQMWLRKVYGNTSNRDTSGSFKNTALVPLQSKSVTPPTKPGEIQIMTNKLDPLIPDALSHQRILERELEAVRDARDQQATLLSEARIAKRKLEEDFDYERNLRRRLQRRLDDAQKELALARKMETYALDQVRREVEARRKAEDIARVEKNQKLALQRISVEKAPQHPHDVSRISGEEGEV